MDVSDLCRMVARTNPGWPMEYIHGFTDGVLDGLGVRRPRLMETCRPGTIAADGYAYGFSDPVRFGVVLMMIHVGGAR